MVTGEYEPDSPAGLDLITDIRSDVHAIDGANAQVGGSAATELDARDGNAQDFLTIAPMILAISFIILLGILRAQQYGTETEADQITQRVVPLHPANSMMRRRNRPPRLMLLHIP